MSNIQVRDFSEYTDLLPVQFSDSENLIKLLQIYLDQVEELNLAQQDLSLLSTNLETATGYQLDIIGNLLGAKRNGADDEGFRDAIKFRISINTGSGTPEDVIGFLRTVTKATTTRYWEHYPASIVVETNGTDIASNLASTIDNVSPAGVKVGGVLWVEGDYAFRPCRLSEAYLNLVDIEEIVYPEVAIGDDDQFLGSPTTVMTPLAERTYRMGQDDAYMGNPNMRMRSPSFNKKFTYLNPNTTIGQSVLPNMSEVYSEFYLGAGDDAAFSGNPSAVASGLSVTQGGIVMGTLANVLTDKND